MYYLGCAFYAFVAMIYSFRGTIFENRRSRRARRESF